MAKILLVGDDYIGREFLREGFAIFREQGYEIAEFDWLQGGLEKLSGLNRLIEKEGPGCRSVRIPDEVRELIRDADMLVIQFFPVSRELLESAPRLSIIGTVRTGLENIDVACARERNIAIFNTPGRLAETVSDYAIAFLLAEARNLARGHAALKQGNWRRDYINNPWVPELGGRTVGLMGFGKIGQAVARKLTGWKVTILAADPFARVETARDLDVELTDLDTLLARSDFVSLHANLTKENYNMIGEKQLSLMKPTAIIVNTARGGLIDERALCRALVERRIGGAAIDVFEHEPPPHDHPLLGLDNCTVSPHLAGSSVDCMRNSPKTLARAIFDELVLGKDTGFRVIGRER